MAAFTITIAGDSAINLEFASSISAETSTKIRLAAEGLRADPIKGVIELAAKVRGKLRNLTAESTAVKRIVEIPVCYGGEFGPDIATVAEHANMSEDEVVRVHSGHDYLIDMLGFLPGFAYLGGLDERLHTPRLATPRTRLEAGSVGIGGAQTGVYPLPSPGGWQIIGRTPVRPYDPDRTPPILYLAGDYLRFVPITPSEYQSIDAQVKSGTYECTIIVEEK